MAGMCFVIFLLLLPKSASAPIPGVDYIGICVADKDVDYKCHGRSIAMIGTNSTEFSIYDNNTSMNPLCPIKIETSVSHPESNYFVTPFHINCYVPVSMSIFLADRSIQYSLESLTTTAGNKFVLFSDCEKNCKYIIINHKIKTKVQINTTGNQLSIETIPSNMTRIGKDYEMGSALQMIVIDYSNISYVNVFVKSDSPVAVFCIGDISRSRRSIVQVKPLSYFAFQNISSPRHIRVLPVKQDGDIMKPYSVALITNLLDLPVAVNLLNWTDDKSNCLIVSRRVYAIGTARIPNSRVAVWNGTQYYKASVLRVNFTTCPVVSSASVIGRMISTAESTAVSSRKQISTTFTSSRSSEATTTPPKRSTTTKLPGTIPIVTRTIGPAMAPSEITTATKISIKTKKPSMVTTFPKLPTMVPTLETSITPSTQTANDIVRQTSKLVMTRSMTTSFTKLQTTMLSSTVYKSSTPMTSVPTKTLTAITTLFSSSITTNPKATMIIPSPSITNIFATTTYGTTIKLSSSETISLSQITTGTTTKPKSSPLRSTTVGAENITQNVTYFNTCDVNTMNQSIASGKYTYQVGMCTYRCKKEIVPDLNDPAQQQILAGLITELKRVLSINKTQLSSSIRKKVSVMDNRPSVKAIGLVGVTIICGCLGIILSADVPRVLKYFSICKRSSTRSNRRGRERVRKQSMAKLVPFLSPGRNRVSSSSSV